jgi:Domain of unknown function (DUF5753)
VRGPLSGGSRSSFWSLLPIRLPGWSCEIENKAATLRAWSPGIVHGLPQTSDYARAFLVTVPGVTEQQATARLNSRMERQNRVLKRDDPPSAWFVVDEMSLYRRAGSPAAMAEQLRHLAEVAKMPATEHSASASELIIADNAAYVEHLAGGLVYTGATQFPSC